ncbi:MAG: hypothetical protein WC454_07895 [Phycisphaerae bacterium]
MKLSILMSALEATWQDIKVNKFRVGWKGLKRELPSWAYTKQVFSSAVVIAEKIKEKAPEG